MTAPTFAGLTLDEIRAAASDCRTEGHLSAADVLDALAARLTETHGCLGGLRRACVSGEEYQRLAEELDRLRESYRMACRMLRDAEAERDRARELAARLEADGARLRERVAEIATAAEDHADRNEPWESCGCCQSSRIARKLRGALDAPGGAS